MSRVRARWSLGLLSAAVIIAGAGYVFTRGGDDSDQASLPTPHSITRAGVTYEVGPTPPAGASVDPQDPRTLTLYAFEAEHPDQPECSSLDPQARLVKESSGEVRIATFTYSARDVDADEEVNCGYVSDATEAAPYKELKFTLKEPLGDRRLIDDKSGDDIGVLDPSYSPKPSYLPPGFKQSLVMHFTPEDSFVALRQYRDKTGRSSLEIQVRSVTAWGERGKVLAHDKVGSVDATVTEENYQRCVNWSPRAGLVAEVCSLPASMSPDVLLRIARSIPALP